MTLEKLIAELEYSFCPIKYCRHCDALFGADLNTTTKHQRTTFLKTKIYCSRGCKDAAVYAAQNRRRKESRGQGNGVPLNVLAIQGYLCGSPSWEDHATLGRVKGARYYEGTPYCADVGGL